MLRKKLFQFFTILIIFVLTLDIGFKENSVNAEYFTSVDKLQKLIDVELNLVKVFRGYLETQYWEFEKFDKFINDVKLQHRTALKNKRKYFENPINIVTQIKRLTIDWPKLNNFLNQTETGMVFRQILEDFHEDNEMPRDNDLLGAVKGLARLQKVYDLKAEDLSKGVINGIKYRTKLTWHDCFEIGANLYDQQEFKLSLKWFEKTLEKLNKMRKSKRDETQRKFKIECLEYLATTNYRLGFLYKSLLYEKILQKLEPKRHTKNLSTYLLSTPKTKKEDGQKMNNMDFYYRMLCQGKQLPQKKLRKLKCSFETLKRPYFILAPLKVEQLSIDPAINLYHGVLTNVQIERTIAEAENNMERSKLAGGEPSEIRISQQAWLEYESPTLKTIYNLVGHITGLNLTNSEKMQVANYGVGGQYDLHHDFFGPGFSHPKYIGDRIVTCMFYLSNVDQGGHTVFPKINVYSRPIKGALIVWHNLHKSLDADYRTFHAGCPVIKGSKRISNVWIHSGYQEFTRPCALENDKLDSK